MLDSMYQEGTDQVLDDRVARPLQAPTVRPSFGANLWNTTKAPFAGVGAGANESAGFFSDILGAYGAVQAGIGLQADPSLLFDSEAQAKRKQEGQQSRDAIQSGEAFSTDLGTGFRAAAKTYFMPDPHTANAAEQILFGFGRFATKAIGYTMAGGPVAGPVLTAVDEGMTEADKLKAEGVDFATRTKVGAVAGVAAGAAVALPVAGKTVAETAGLVAAGGPGAFIAQQAASKAILEHAGYDKIAEQYDPFDPVGLIVSTLVPAAFGTHAMRSAKAKAKPAIDPEAVDAARVDQVQQQIVESNPYHPADVAGANDHIAAVERAHDQMAAGEPVNVTDIIDVNRLDPVKVQQELDQRLAIAAPDYVTNPAKTSMDRANRITSDLLADPNIPAEVKTRLQEASIQLMKPENKAYVAAVDAARKTGNLDPTNIDRIHQAMQDLPFDRRQDSATRKTVDQMTPDELRQALLVDDMTGLGNRRAYDESVKQPFQASIDIDSLKWVNDNLGHEGGDRLIGALGQALREESAAAYHLSGDEFAAQFGNAEQGHALFARVRDRLKEAVIEATLPDGTKITKKGVEFSYGIAKTIQEADIGLRADKSAREASGQRAGRGAEPLGVSKKSPAGQQDNQRNSASQAVASSADQASGNGKPSPFEAQTAELARTSPDMMVQLEGMDKPMRLADAMEAIKSEAARDSADAPLLQVAADCFLRSA